MNGIERFNALLRQEPVDKIPVRVGNYNVFLIHYYKITVREYLDYPALNAELFVRMVKEFDLDSLKAGLGYIFYGCGPELGPTWEFPENNFPASTKGIIDRPEDLDMVVIPPEPRGYFRKFLEINRRVKAAIGNDTHLGVSILGPFSAMAFLRGCQNLLMDMILDPDFFAQLMKKGEEVSLFIGRHCMALELHWANLLEIFLVPGMINPESFHSQIAPHDDSVCNKLSSPPISNYLSVFMGRAGDPQSQRDGKLINNYYFGTSESLEAIRSASKYMVPGFPRLVSLSGNALVHWPIDRILSFLRQGLDYFVMDRGEYPCIFLASIQSENQEQAKNVGDKLRAIAEFRDSYPL